MTKKQRLKEALKTTEDVSFSGIAPDADGVRYLRPTALNANLQKARYFLKEAINECDK